MYIRFYFSSSSTTIALQLSFYSELSELQSLRLMLLLRFYRNESYYSLVRLTSQLSFIRGLRGFMRFMFCWVSIELQECFYVMKKSQQLSGQKIILVSYTKSILKIQVVCQAISSHHQLVLNLKPICSRDESQMSCLRLYCWAFLPHSLTSVLLVLLAHFFKLHTTCC